MTLHPVWQFTGDERRKYWMTEIHGVLDNSLKSNLPETLVEMSRLKGLSDGIFAFALTLLVLDLRLPENVLSGDLAANLLRLAPKVLIYLISFVIIGGAWGSHQRMLAQIQHGDGLLVWLNLFSLLFVSIVPASAALLGRFPEEILPITIFAVNAVLIQLTAQWLWRHASRHGLTNPTLDARVVEGIARRLNLSAILFGLSIPLAWLSTTLAYLIWIGTYVLLFTTDWLSWQQAFKTQQASIPLEDARSARIRLNHWRGRLNINSHAANNLLQGVFGGGLDCQVSRSEGVVDVQLNPGITHSFMNLKFPWAWGPANIFDWNFSLKQQFPILLEIMSSNGEATLELGELQITELILTANVSSMMIILPANAGQTSVNIRASNLSLILRVPPEVGARILTSRVLTGNEIDLERFLMTDQAGEYDREYRSADYATAAQQVDIHMELAGGSVQIDNEV
jgi:uncharacterized membrane protein